MDVLGPSSDLLNPNFKKSSKCVLLFSLLQLNTWWKLTQGRKVHFDSQFRGRSRPPRRDFGIRNQGTETALTFVHAIKRQVVSGLHYKTSKPSPSGPFPPARLPKGSSTWISATQLRIKSSNTWAYGGVFIFKPQGDFDWYRSLRTLVHENRHAITLNIESCNF